MMANPNGPAVQALSPEVLANQLFDGALVQYKGDPREAARQVINFLAETLVCMISATAGDEGTRRALLKSAGDSIAAAPAFSSRAASKP